MNQTVAGALLREAFSCRRALRLSKDDLAALAHRRLRWLLERAECTSFYRERLRLAGGLGRGHIASDPHAVLCALPPVTKRELRDAGARVLAGGRVDRAWRATSSSGSTGEPFQVHYDPRAWAILKYLVKWRARAACGVHPHHRVALLDAIPPNTTGRSPLERLGRLRRISVLQPADRIARALAAFAPDAIYGLPSALLETANALRAMGQSLSPKGIFTSGELLQPAVRRDLRGGYGCPVFDIYGSSETKEIAWECRAGSMHVNADVVWLEVLDEAGEPVLPGEEGAITATLLVNGAMPLVRYRIGDRGSLLPGPCRCGLAFPRLGIVTGREADILELEDGRRISPYALTCALEGVRGVVRYQVAQVARTRLDVRVMLAAGADQETVAAGVRSALRAAVPGALEVDVAFVEHFETGPRAKFRVVQPLRLTSRQPSTLTTIHRDDS